MSRQVGTPQAYIIIIFLGIIFTRLDMLEAIFVTLEEFEQKNGKKVLKL
jgi:hypothetical protein